ncbi:unnamed protein product (macronuclear) [Paramecium tetraurelia]|uniref:PAS domain-containing protein n=1 Tax=Paramecium tetraurelia TaxID=5888 RepID=A0D628_PARTE|nr:uncharacterized protein GSPATT00013925001 [Paramecium tetraurelia]CAK78495.1 unnamed protein product [Paramecium tetraurelia]|eukprot:XP_001445892.1 hypothetical protein (macronuclear) [Paramecium tetraurelia strain d4-2]
MDDEMVHINKALQYVFIILSSFQQLSFAFENYYFQNIQHNGFKNFFLEISSFTRPYVKLFKSFGVFSFIIPLVLLISYEVMIFYIFICFVKCKKQKRMSEILLEQNRLFQLILKIYSYQQGLLYYLIFIPQLEFATSSIYYYSQKQYLNLFALPMAVICFIMIILNMLFYLFCIQQSTHIKVKNLNILSQSFNHYLNPIYLILIVCINRFESNDKQLKFYLTVTILLIKSSFNIYSIYTTFQNIYRRCIIELFSECFQFSMSLILMLIQLSQFKSQYKDYETILILIIIPLATSVPIILYNNLHYRIILNKNQMMASYLMLYKIASIIDEFGEIKHSYLHDNQKITQIIYFQQTHLQHCSTPKCLCTQQLLTFEQIINLYLKDQVNYFNLTINKLKKQSNKQLYFLHYLSLIHYLGLSTRAFQQSNLVVYQESENFSSQFSKVLIAKAESQKAESSNSLDQQHSSVQRSKVDSKSDEMIHIKIQNMGFINKQRLVLIQELIKKTMSTGLGKQSNQILSDNLDHAVKLFLKSEESNKQLKNKIIKMINKKKDFFVNLTLLNSNFNLFNAAKQMITKLTYLEDELLKLYFQFPSRKMQALNTFYQSEVMNNYFQAYKLATITSISDEKLFKMQSQINFDMFSSKLDYIIVGFDEKSHKLQIRQYSNQIHEFFGYNQEKFKQLKTIDHLLPNNFDQIHSKFVQQFLSQGYSKFFRLINQNYCRYQKKFIKAIDFFFDINVSNLQDLTFACFFQNKDSSNAFIFCCNNNRIQSVSKNFANKIGYPAKLITQLMDSLYKQPLSKIFPKLQMIMEMNGSKISQDNDEFEQELMDQSEYQVHMILPEVDCLLKNSKQTWDTESNSQQYVVEAIFHNRKLKQDTLCNYVIVEIREAKRYQKTCSTPFQTEVITPTPGASLTQFQDDGFEDLEFLEQDEFQANIPRALEFDQQENQNQIMNLYQDQSESDGQFGRKILSNSKNQSQSFYPNVSLVSPKDAGEKLIDAKSIEGGLYDNNKRYHDAKQQFFSAVDQKDVSSNADEESMEEVENENEIENKNQIDKLQIEDIDQELQENIKMQMQLEEQDQNIVQIDDIGSQVSSVAAFKKSKYSKKYDLIQKLITSEKFSKNYFLARTFLTVLFALFTVFSIVQIIFSSDDLNRFLQELDMVQIKSNIVAPIDNYIVAQNAVMFYAILNMIGMMNASTAAQKLEYAKNDITYNYEELKSSYIKQLSNKYLNPFFQDKNFTIMQSEQTTTSDRNVSAREAIYLSLEAAYQFVLLDYLNIFTSLDPTSGFFVYLFGNYQTFYEQLTIVNQDMLSYSVQRSITVKEKWLSLMIPILIIGFLLLSIIVKFHNQYLQQYDQFIQLFSMLEIVWVQRDIDRYKGISSLVIKDSDVLFKYQFDIDLKEKFLAAEDIRKEKIAQNQKGQKQRQKATNLNFNQSTTKLPSLVIYSTIYALCFGLCFISTSLGESYFVKYPDTTNFFNTLCDVSIASTGVFSVRQIIYVVSNKNSQAFFFIKDTTYFIQVFFEHIETINQFLAQMSEFDPSTLITSDAFINKIEQLMQNDVCEFLPDFKIESAQMHCDSLYDGVVRRGFQLALNTVRNELLTEYKNSQNFSIQSYTLNEQLEIGLISYDAVSNIKLQFQDELVRFTYNLIDQILIINICAIILYLISIGLIYKIITQIYHQEFKLVLKFILLMPQTSLFLDSQLDRTIKQIIIKHNLT